MEMYNLRLYPYRRHSARSVPEMPNAQIDEAGRAFCGSETL